MTCVSSSKLSRGGGHEAEKMKNSCCSTKREGHMGVGQEKRHDTTTTFPTLENPPHFAPVRPEHQYCIRLLADVLRRQTLLRDWKHTSTFCCKSYKSLPLIAVCDLLLIVLGAKRATNKPTKGLCQPGGTPRYAEIHLICRQPSKKKKISKKTRIGRHTTFMLL